MDAKPTPNVIITVEVYSPPRKREKANHLSKAEKQTIIYAYKKITTDTPKIRKTEMVEKISQVLGKYIKYDIHNILEDMILGISRTTVYRTITEYKNTGKTSEPKKITGRRSLLESFDENVKTAVHEIVTNMLDRNELPTLDNILTEVKNCSEVPKMSRSTLYRLLKQLKFK